MFSPQFVPVINSTPSLTPIAIVDIAVAPATTLTVADNAVEALPKPTTVAVVAPAAATAGAAATTAKATATDTTTARAAPIQSAQNPL